MQVKDSFDIHAEEKNGVWIVKVSGVLDAETNMKFGVFLNDLLDKGALRFIFDLSELGYINSQGIGTLVSIFKKVEGKGRACFLKPSQEVEHIIQLTGLKALFTIKETESDAIAFCRA
jgi:anti-anti-sigma factor